MSDFFSDPRLVEGEEYALEAEAHERDRDISKARDRYMRASELYAATAMRGDAAPKARSVIAVSAVCLAARAGRFDRAIEYAERFLSEPGSYGEEGVRTLTGLLASYREVAFAATASAASPRAGRLYEWRDHVRDHYGREAA